MKIFTAFNQFFHDVLHNKWKPMEGSKYEDGTPQFVVDGETKKPYFNETPKIVRLKHLALTVATPVVQIALTALKIVKLVTLYHFWAKPAENAPRSFKASKLSAYRDLQYVVKAPIYTVGLTLAAIFGLVAPNDARKLYATLESEQNEGFAQLAPCFQPYPTYHLLGGNPNERDAF